MRDRNARVPNLRFPEFRDAGAWEEKRLGEVADVNPKASTLPKEFVYIDLESVVSGSLIKENNIQKSGAPSRAQRLLKNGDILFQMVRPYQKNNYYFDKEGDYVASTGYAQLRAKGVAKFLFQTLHTTSFVNKVLARCTGTSYPAINSSDVAKIHFLVPTLPEQQKIADCLTSIDDLITAQGQKLDGLKAHKKGLMQQLFPAEGETVPKLRFPEFRDAEPWEGKPLAKLISTVSPPKKFLTVEYAASGKYPIIDQSQDFICGWTNDNDAIIRDALPLIVFGDHTCCLKKVVQPFAQGADGIKILDTKKDVSVNFLFQFLQAAPLEMKGYRRHFSILKEKNVTFPSIKSGEQQKIAACLTSLDDLITAQAQKLEQLKAHKKGLMQQIFPAADEVNA